MKKVTIKTATEECFFQRGRVISRALDAYKAIPCELLLTFEDPNDLIKLFSGGRINLLRSIKKYPGSISEIAKRLNRNRSAVKRDIDAMQSAGLITVIENIEPCNRIEEVRVIAQKISLQVDIF